MPAVVTCKVCDDEIYNPANQTLGICRACSEPLGIIAMPPPRRPARPCAACNKLRFIRVIPREYSAYGHVALASPMYLTRDTDAKDRALFQGKSVATTPSLADGRGLLEAYVCASCGRIEWYCHDPEAIPIGAEFMSDVVDYEHGEPYR